MWETKEKKQKVGNLIKDIISCLKPLDRKVTSQDYLANSLITS